MSKAVALALHAAVVAGLAGLALTRGVDVLPAAPTIMAMAFVADSPVPPPAPPPPPAARAVARTVEPPARPSPSESAPLAPLAPQPEVRPEPDASPVNTVAGVEGGIGGGVPGGSVDGIVGGLASEPPPSPPPPANVPKAPVRIGGVLREPVLLHRVEPVYPGAASVMQLTGVVILEAVVDKSGCVESVKVLRSRHLLLDNAAIEALKQWRYAPLELNGTSVSFVMTVTFNFSIQGQNHGR